MCIRDRIHLSEIALPDGVEIPELAQGPEHDHAIVSIHKIKAAPAAVEAEEGEAEAESEGEAESDGTEAAEE